MQAGFFQTFSSNSAFYVLIFLCTHMYFGVWPDFTWTTFVKRYIPTHFFFQNNTEPIKIDQFFSGVTTKIHTQKNIKIFEIKNNAYTACASAPPQISSTALHLRLMTKTSVFPISIWNIISFEMNNTISKNNELFPNNTQKLGWFPCNWLKIV